MVCFVFFMSCLQDAICCVDGGIVCYYFVEFDCVACCRVFGVFCFVLVLICDVLYCVFCRGLFVASLRFVLFGVAELCLCCA